jgi:predicted transcriptional regulator
MHAPPDHWPGEPRYHASLEVHLDAGTHRKLMHFVTAFRRSQSEVIRQVLQWGLTHGQGWQLDRGRRPAPHHIVVRLEPELRHQVEAAARAAGGDISAWLRHAVRQVTVADFPASWQAARREPTARGSTRSHDSRHYRKRFMMRLDDASTRKLDELAQHFDRSTADVLRQLIAQASPNVFPKSWRLAAEERQQQQARDADTGKARRS